MMRTLLATLTLLMAQSAMADAKGKTTYVGDGRYSCTGNAQECAAVRQRNEQLEEIRRNRRELEASRQAAERRQFSNTAGNSRNQ
jgi:hypothetical protein